MTSIENRPMPETPPESTGEIAQPIALTDGQVPASGNGASAWEKCREKLVQLKQLWQTPVLATRWPEHREFAMWEALQQAGAAPTAVAYKNVLEVAWAQSSVGQCPIIAVLGELNAGKSSVVAGFLGEAGRRRLPRGVAESKGTHRFVYWAPAKWKTSERRNSTFSAVLAAAHGDQREDLSLDPEKAAEQYRSGRDNLKKMEIPLVAYDERLNDIEAAFLDCPDVQTADQDGQPDGANKRLEFLARAAGVCSAFLLVWDRAKLREQLLTEVLERLRGRMPKARFYLLANKVRPKDGEPAEMWRDIDGQRLIERFGLNALYMAWDFDIVGNSGRRGWRELTPPGLLANWRQQDPLPQFFQLDASNTHSPASTHTDWFLPDLPRQLDAAELQTQTLASQLEKAQQLVGTAMEELTRWTDDANKRMREVHHGLLSFCVGQFTGPEGESLQFPFPGFTDVLRKSFTETAPWYLRASFRFNDVVGDFISTTRRRLQQLIKTAQLLLVSDGAIGGTVSNELREHHIVGAQKADARSFAEQMHVYKWVASEHSVDSLEEAWARVLKDFAHFELPVDEQRLNKLTAEIWQNLSVWQQVRASGKAIVGTLAGIAALGGVLVAVVDGGATFVSFSLAQSLSTALPGGLAAGVGAAGATLAAFNSTAKSLARECTLPALSAMFALACDTFGVPRSVDGEDAKIRVTLDMQEFPLADLEVPKRPAVCWLGPTGDLGLWQTGDGLQQYKGVFDD